MADTTHVLTIPSDKAVIPPLADFVISSMGTILSPTTWVRTVISWVFNWDPLTEVMKVFAGDWNAVAQAGRAYEMLGEWADLVEEEVGVATTKVQADWEGNAADAASTYMTGTLAPNVTAMAAAFKDIGGEYSAVAVGMHRTAQLGNTAFNTVCDWLIYTAAIAAATAASSWTIVGGIAGGAATAAAVAKTLTAVSAASNALTAGQTLVDSAAGIIPGYLGALDGFSTIDAPGAYDHQGV
ncbi:hypothetical protein EXU48_10055 [Occultella glacieicola]|uniref:PPE family domain-containing protein n=1 Tax=Occultella glacieicola TaxID=2518684 RepID=A0ABY2E9V6_9MICO|nr:hypothetical protein [Occultella glacieicola]TDE95092.1 hypothetical protein EXU48_10055 [Occultella glacieicola]